MCGEKCQSSLLTKTEDQQKKKPAVIFLFGSRTNPVFFLLRSASLALYSCRPWIRTRLLGITVQAI